MPGVAGAQFMQHGFNDESSSFMPQLPLTNPMQGSYMAPQGYGQMPGMGQMPMGGQMPGMGQMPMGGQMPGMGQMPMGGQMPGMGQMPMGGQMPGMGQMPMGGQMPGMGQLTMGSQEQYVDESSQYVPVGSPADIGGQWVKASINQEWEDQ